MDKREDAGEFYPGGKVVSTRPVPAESNYFDGAEYVQSYGAQNRPALLFKHGSQVLVAVDATPFVKDGIVSNVEISGGNLVITFNTDSGKQPISIPLTDIFDPDNYYDKTAVDNKLAGKQDTLTFDNAPTTGSNNPVKSGGIWSAIWGALSAIPTGFSSLYDWCVSQLAPKAARTELFPTWRANVGYLANDLVVHDNAIYRSTSTQSPAAEWDPAKWALATGAEVLAILRNYAAQSNKPQINGVSLSSNKTGADLGVLDLAGGTMTGDIALGFQNVLGRMSWIEWADTIPGNKLRMFGAWESPNNGMSLFLQGGTANNAYATIILRPQGGNLAYAASPATAGNLAALDADGNPTDVGYRFEVRNGIPYIIETTND